MKILIINAGSSSLKYQFMESDGGEVFAKGLCERIGIDGRLTHKVPGRENVVMDIPMPTHNEAIQSVLDIMVDPEKGVIASTDESPRWPPGPPRRRRLHRELHHRRQVH